MNKYLAHLTVFLTGGSILVIEILGSRLFAPHLGTSLIVWTSLIGVILAALSIGYWLGGKLADKTQSIRVLSLLLFAGAAGVAYILLLESQLLVLFSGTINNIYLATVLAALVLFTPASILLAMVSPYTTRLCMHNMNDAGRVLGTISAVGTLGSIFGTFIAGFYLISHWSHHTILMGITLLLLLLSFIIHFKTLRTTRALLSIVIFLMLLSSVDAAKAYAQQRGIMEIPSAYHRILIQDTKEPNTGEPIRMLRTDAHSAQSIMYINRPNDLAAVYTKYYRLVEHYKPETTRALLIGGGAYSYPKQFLERFPNAHMDIVEIDPTMTDVAHEYFALPHSARLQMFHEDGRMFLNQGAANQYDAIFLDTFRSFVSIPHHLSTKEAVQEMRRLLKPDGVVIINLVSGVQDDERSLFLQSLIKTFHTSFSHIDAFAAGNVENSLHAQNVVLIAANHQTPLHSQHEEMQDLLENAFTAPTSSSALLLTDDFAPTDQLLMPLLR